MAMYVYQRWVRPNFVYLYMWVVGASSTNLTSQLSKTLHAMPEVVVHNFTQSRRFIEKYNMVVSV